MKNIFWILILALTFASCAGEGENSGSDADVPAATNITNPVTPPDPALGTPAATPPAPVQNTVNIPAGPDGVVHHYICEKMDGGNGPAGGPCPICGEAMAHNSAFHAQGNDQSDGQSMPNVTFQNADGSTTPGSVGTSPPGGGPQAAPPPEPPQNAAGVWHYTCPSGCAGGGGSATACGKCGTTLVHNTAYHQ